MNIKVNLQDGTPAQFKTEIIDGAIVVTVVEEKKEEVNLFPKWEELGGFSGYYTDESSKIGKGYKFLANEHNNNIFSTENLAKASLATARVSQTYKRYRELVGDVGNFGILRCYGLLSLAFEDVSDWDRFYKANKEDLDLINHVEDTVQL